MTKVTELEESEKYENMSKMHRNIFCAPCCSRTSDVKEDNCEKSLISTTLYLSQN